MISSVSPAPIITAHAIIRWLERAHNIDISLLKVQTQSSSDMELLGQIDLRIPGFSATINAHLRDVCRKVFALGGPHYRTQDALFIFNGPALVTVLSPNMKAPITGAAA